VLPCDSTCSRRSITYMTNIIVDNPFEILLLELALI
jgi:hypothetical protein